MKGLELVPGKLGVKGFWELGAIWEKNSLGNREGEQTFRNYFKKGNFWRLEGFFPGFWVLKLGLGGYLGRRFERANSKEGRLENGLRFPN